MRLPDVLCGEGKGIAKRRAGIDQVLATPARGLTEEPPTEPAERVENELVVPAELGLRVGVVELMQQFDVLPIRNYSAGFGAVPLEGEGRR